MTGSFTLTPSASRDIDGILEYVLEQSGRNRALDVHRKLHEGFSRIGAQPKLLGHVRDDFAFESLRVYLVFPFFIIYLPETKPVQILRVIHGARDVPNAFEEDA